MWELRVRRREELLYLKDDGKSVFLLGYTFELTRTEYIILEALLGADKPISCRELVQSYIGVDKARESSIAVHVCNINKKAWPISKRQLIINVRSKGYLIREDI
jgi:DNA-binding response OmpR family regulator